MDISTLTLETVVVHTITYFVAGILAYTLGGYEKIFPEPPRVLFAERRGWLE